MAERANKWIVAHHSMTWGGWAHKQGIPLDNDVMLDEIASLGYKGVEVGGTVESLGKPEDFLKKCESRGLSIVAFCSFLTAIPDEKNMESYRRAVEYTRDLGVEVLMVCGGWLPEQRRNTWDEDYAIFADVLKKGDEYGRKHGVALAYHPHVACLVETIAETEQLLRHAPDLRLTVDSGHLVAVRQSPSEFVDKFGEKVIHLHLKDWDTSKRKFAELGDGNAGFDFPGFFDALERNGYKGAIVVERDDPPMPAVESARISKAFLDTVL